MKNILRKRYLKLRKEYPLFERFYENTLLQKTILDSKLWKNSEVIALYHSFNNEVDTTLLFQNGMKTNKIILLPKILKNHHMIMTRFNPHESLTYNKYGILESSSKHQSVIDKENIDLMIIPALAIDKAGYRLGYGGGYYDRYLENQTHICKIGLAYSFAFTKKTLPHNQTDISVDYVATVNGLKRIEKYPLLL